MNALLYRSAILTTILALPTASIAQGQSDTQGQSNAQSSQQDNAQRQSNQQAQSQRDESTQASNSSQNQSQDQSSGPSPYSYPDDSFITLDGTVKSITANSFVLTYGDGDITVEMDDADRQSEAYALREGDKVSVAGIVDDDVFENKTIEASSVYVEKIDTIFYASAIDEEDISVVALSVFSDQDEPIMTVQGKVQQVNSEEFVLDTGSNDVTVDIDELSNNPLDQEGYPRIIEGDVVSVTGEINNDFFEGRELVADRIVKVHQRQ